MDDLNVTATELEIVEKEIEVLKKVLKGVKGAENTSVICPIIATNIAEVEYIDGFLAKDGGSAGSNQYHQLAPTPADGGCCVVL